MHTHIYIHQPYTQNKERMNITQKKREMQKPFYKRRSTRNKSQTLYQMMMMVMNEAAKKLWKLAGSFCDCKQQEQQQTNKQQIHIHTTHISKIVFMHKILSLL